MAHETFLLIDRKTNEQVSPRFQKEDDAAWFANRAFPMGYWVQSYEVITETKFKTLVTNTGTPKCFLHEISYAENGV
jgi:hypothetical protein